MVTPDFGGTLRLLAEAGMAPVPERVELAVPHARGLLWQGLRHLVGAGAQWLPEYEHVARWLAGNGGLGLMAMGNCGRGKTLLVGRVVPLVIHMAVRRIVAPYSALDMNDRPDEVKSRHLVYIDDVGTEGVSVRYGVRRLVFPEVVDEAEKRGHLLLCSTNLTPDELRQRYGERTLDRLRAIVRPVAFSGASLRGAVRKKA